MFGNYQLISEDLTTVAFEDKVTRSDEMFNVIRIIIDIFSMDRSVGP